MRPTDPDPAEALFAAERPRLLGLAYRVLGSRVDAEDLVQEAWLRYQRTGPENLDSPQAWLTTVVSRLALDQLKSARSRRETYVGEWLPEPVRTPLPEAGDDVDPADAAIRAESLTAGFLHVLESLTPIERVAFLLADVFAVPHGRIAEILDRSPAACRQMASRARRKVRAEPHAAPHDHGTEVLDRMVAALGAGDADTVIRLLSDDAVLISDGGGVVHAAVRPVVGGHRVGRFLVNLARRLGSGEGFEVEIASLNAEPGAVVRVHGEVTQTVSASIAEGLVRRLYIMRNPVKLSALDHAHPMW